MWLVGGGGERERERGNGGELKKRRAGLALDAEKKKKTMAACVDSFVACFLPLARFFDPFRILKRLRDTKALQTILQTYRLVGS